MMAVVLSSCKKWLEVQPEDKVTELQVFSDLASASTALNGMYLQMTNAALYGGNLSMTMIETLGQRYNIGVQHTQTQMQNYQYGETNVKVSVENTWEAAFVVVVNANAFLRSLDVYAGSKIPARYDSIMRGEALALRAMMHFDMLRLFGPIYNTKDSLAKSIPYYRKAIPEVSELYPANQVIDSVLADLKAAEQYLQRDPIISYGVEKFPQGDGLDFFRNRNMRMNYYAVKALQARVHLYRNDKAAAMAAAKAVVDGGGKWFPWVVPARILSDRINPDRVFSSELIMGLFNIKLYSANTTYFAPEVAEKDILAPNDTRLKAVFESNENDYRYTPLWIVPSAGGKTFRTFYKYTDVASKDSIFRYKQGLIRLSEMYYIMAECEPDANAGRAWINTVRRNRGLTDLAATASVNTELQKEYQKEFWGEGQLFFYYKRRNVTTIPNSAATSGNVTMNATKYVVPLPLTETQYR
jgi:hypothetical protein